MITCESNSTIGLRGEQMRTALVAAQIQRKGAKTLRRKGERVFLDLFFNIITICFILNLRISFALCVEFERESELIQHCEIIMLFRKSH